MITRIRQATLDDIPHMATIERLVQLTPWSAAVFEMSLMADDQYWIAVPDRQNAKTPLEENIPIYGFIIASTCPPQANLTNFAIHPKMQKKGIGQHLFDHLLVVLSTQTIQELTLEVRISNQTALRFYEKNGFVAIHRRKDYYRLADHQSHEDALIMSRFFVDKST